MDYEKELAIAKADRKRVFKTFRQAVRDAVHTSLDAISEQMASRETLTEVHQAMRQMREEEDPLRKLIEGMREEDDKSGR